MESNNKNTHNLRSVTDYKNDSNERPRHDTFIRNAFENPRVAYEFFDMHLPKEIKAMFAPHTLKMEKESFVEADLKKPKL